MDGATHTVPERVPFQVIHVMDEKHLAQRVVLAGESVTITPDSVTGARRVWLLARTKLTDDLQASLAAQRAM